MAIWKGKTIRRWWRLLRTAFLALLCAGPAAAQTTGALTGVVRDAETGAAVAGAEVVATSPALPGEQRTRTGRDGAYRLELLPPGRYRVRVPAYQGAPGPGRTADYQAAQRDDVVLRAATTLRVDLALVPAALVMEEQEVRTGPPPVVDVASAETGTTVTRDILDHVPLGRDVLDAAEIAPGVQRDRLGGLDFQGATANENGYLLEGLDVTDPAFGGAPGAQRQIQSNLTLLLHDFVEEEHVRTGSFLPEYGRAMGGIVEVLLKSGSNELHGSVFSTLQPGLLSATPRAVGRNAEAIASQRLASQGLATDFGFELGGPVEKDRLWFYLGFAPRLQYTVDQRYFQAVQEDPAHPGSPLLDANGFARAVRVGPTRNFENSAVAYQAVGKLTWQPAEDHRLALSVVTAPQREGYLASANATDSAGYVYDTTTPIDAVARYTGQLLDRHLVLEAQAGWHHQAVGDDPRVVAGVDQRTTSQVRWDGDGHTLRDFFSPAELGAAYDACAPTASGFQPCAVQRFRTGGGGLMVNATIDRLATRLAGAGLFELAGHHELKAGLDLERLRYADTRFYGGTNFIRERNGPSGPIFQDFANFYGLAGGAGETDDPALVLRNASLTATSVSDSRALFLQDSWTILDNLVLNGGLRWETQSMWHDGAPGPPPIDLKGNLGPRVQAIWDFTGMGRGAVKASWGRFYEALPLDLADRLFGGETTVHALRSACAPASPGVGGQPASCPVVPGGLTSPSTGNPVTYVQSGSLGAALPVAPDLKGQYVDHFSASVEYELLSDLSVALVYEGRRLGRVIEDMSPDDGQHYFLANPAESGPITLDGQRFDPRFGTYLDPVTGQRVTLPEPKPERRYDGITLEVRKTFSRRWLLQASYTYSSLRGNYPGLTDLDLGQVDPNITSQYDLVQLMTNRNGPLPGDSPHQLKLFGAYVFELGPRVRIGTGAAFRVRSGTPVNILASGNSDLGYGPGESYLLPRGSGGRTPAVSQLDLHGGLTYALAPPYAIRFTVDLFNVLNQQAPLAVDQNYTFDDVQPVKGGACAQRNAAGAADPVAAAQADCPDLRNLRTTDGRTPTVNRNFGRPTLYQAPFSVRFGLALTF